MNMLLVCRKGTTFLESVRKSVAHLNFIIDNQLFIKGVPHLIEHSPFLHLISSEFLCRAMAPVNLSHLPSAARPRAGGAAVAVLVQDDRAAFERRLIEIAEVADAGYFQIEHLVKVAVVQVAFIAHRNGVAAHHPGHGAGIESVEQALHITLIMPGFQQVIEEAADGHIGDGVEIIEFDAVLPAQLALEIGFQGGLVAGQKSAGGIVDQIQLQACTRLGVPGGIQQLQRLDGILEHAVAPLAVGTQGAVMGQRRHDLHAPVGKKLRQIAVFRVGHDDRQVAAIDNVLTQFRTLVHEPAEIRIHLRGAAGDIHGRNVITTEHVEAELEGRAGHVLGLFIRSGIDVAVDAGLIAEFADVHLEDVDLRRQDAPVREIGLPDLVGELWELCIGQLLPVQYFQLEKGRSQFAMARSK